MVNELMLPKEVQDMHLPEYLVEDICLLIKAREEYQKDDNDHNHVTYLHHLGMFQVSLKEAEHCDRLPKDDIYYLKERYYYR